MIDLKGKMMLRNIPKQISLFLLLLSGLFFSAFLTSAYAEEAEEEFVTIAILAKDKAHVLPLYLSCLEKQTWPASKTYLYIRTNNNTDNTAEILLNWIQKVGSQYAGIFLDVKDVKVPVEKYKQHEWNSERFKVLGKIRQESIDWARLHNSHYFVVDCDNFIQPHTLKTMVETRLPIVAPLLKLNDHHLYANLHAVVDQNGYYADSNVYVDIVTRQIRGLIQVDVVHCAYFIRQEFLDKMSYDDESYRHEYVIFSDTARKNFIPQYIDNRELYGRITFAENKEELDKEPWLFEFKTVSEAFNTIYETGQWGVNAAGEGVSGEGSTEENTRPYRAYLQNFLEEHAIKSVVDAGCGDWQFSKLIDWGNAKYKGYDVANMVIQNNTKRYSNDSIAFVCADFIETDLPKADLFLCKEVLQHLPFKDISRVLTQLKKYKYCLITNDINPYGETINQDIAPGGYRSLDLTKPPFNLSAEVVFTYSSASNFKKQVLLIRND